MTEEWSDSDRNNRCFSHPIPRLVKPNGSFNPLLDTFISARRKQRTERQRFEELLKKKEQESIDGIVLLKEKKRHEGQKAKEMKRD